MTQKVPVLYEYCHTVYDAMAEQSEMQVPTIEDEEEALVYEGFVTHLFKELHFSVPYYTKVMRKLQDMDCIVQVRRGGSTSPSRWILLRAPTYELFQAATESTKKPSRRSRMDTLEQQIRDMNERLNRAGI
jgi:hypothetical protein